MKRDNDYIRKLLFEIEAEPRHLFLAPLHLNSDEEETKKHYHAKLLSDAGFLVEEHDDVFRMTNQGHDYLEAIRSDTVWQKTKDGAAKLGGATLSMMFELAKAYIKQEAAEKLGIEL